METIFISIVAFVVAIGILVAVHEYGHYIVARWCGVKVLRYSIGFGKPLMTWRGKDPDQTEYCISAIPLGGYVKLLDEREGDVDPAETDRAFTRKPVSSRIAILAAGPLMNFAFAIVAYWTMLIIGVPGVQPIVGEVTENSIASRAGVESGDRILMVGNDSVSTWDGAILFILDELLADEPIAMKVVGDQGNARQLQLDVSGRITDLTEPGKLFDVLGFKPWAPVVPALVSEVTPGGPADLAGVLPGDLVVSADGELIGSWVEWVDYVRARPGQNITMKLDRDGIVLDVNAVIGIAEEDGQSFGRIGMATRPPADLAEKYISNQRYGVSAALGEAVSRTWAMSALTVRMIGRMFTGDVSVKNISGPINIAEYAGYSARIGVAPFLNFLAIVSISLGILNLLPVPVLDGGQIVYQAVEAIKGSPVSERAQLIGQQFGIAMLLMVMSLAFYNDLSRFF
ncbi:MAG: RIP metalloprotease RseP [Gammaproteobacteria bacterium]|nr:RIP metalloprotease RseP [Gammaproteobacteria bacterium]